MSTGRQYASVSELLQDIAPDGEFPAEFEEHVQRRGLIKHLLALRAAKGLAQRDLAEKLGCTQSRISKLENGTDDELRLGDLVKYVHALGLDFGIAMRPPSQTVFDEIKYHAFCIKDRLEHLVKLAGEDQAMQQGVGEAHIETLLNLMKIVVDSVRKLPVGPETKSPYIRIEMCGSDVSRQVARDDPSSLPERTASP
ncbi:MAG: helix-turn-helix domain-containing protein [Planctomycetota bacterium]|jgi:transcriptional regulator with XRE-family HTH domain